MKVMKANAFASIKDIDREEWLKLRKNGIGGSDAAGILGLSTYSSPFRVYADKLDLIEPQEDNEAMRQGRDLEAYVVERFKERMAELGTPKKVRECSYMLSHPQHPWMLANVDRLIVGELAGLECKTTSVLNLKNFKNGEYPDHYYAQCVHYMAVTGARRWYLAVLVSGKDFYVYTIERDEEEIKALINAERTFWEENVLKQIPPLADGSDATNDTIKQVFMVDNEEIEADLFAYETELRTYIECGEKIKEYTKVQELAKQVVQMYMQEASIGKSPNFMVNWKSHSRKNVDTELLKTKYPDAYNACLKSSASRRFTIKLLEDK